MSRRLPTVADLRAAKGRRQMAMLRYFTLDEAAAVEAAGIDIASVPPEILFHRRYRDVAPSIFSMTGHTHRTSGTADDNLLWSGDAIERGADAVYCSGSLQTIKHLAREYIPVVGHVGLVPSRATWTGGFRAVGKTAEPVQQFFHQLKALEPAGAFAVEVEVVSPAVATAISARTLTRTRTMLWSMGAGAGCDAQCPFANDILGYTEGHIPRHSRVYHDFTAEYGRPQAERIAAFTEFAADVATGAYPEYRHLVAMPPDELETFMDRLQSGEGSRLP